MAQPNVPSVLDDRVPAYEPDTAAMNGPLLLAVLEPILALARRNARIAAMLNVQLPAVPDPAQARVAADAIRDTVRECDVVARMSTSRFAVGLLEVWEPDAPVRVAQRLIRALTEAAGVDQAGPAADGGRSPRIGVAFYPTDADDGPGLLESALAATPDRGTIGFADPALGRRALQRAGLVDELANRAVAPQFQLHYQPIRSLDRGEVVGAEALLRWNRSGRVMPAGQFIDLAIASGRIRAIDKWSMEQGFRKVTAWREAGWNGWVAVNLSGRSLDDAGLVDHVSALLDATAAPADGVMFEVTERSALAENRDAARTLDRLRELGVRVAVDDFGSGYASFEYLTHFDPDLVKLDRAFMVQEQGDTDVLGVLVDLAHRMGKPVVVEGVEDPAEMDRVVASRCEFVQGYFTGRPISAHAFEVQHLHHA